MAKVTFENQPQIVIGKIVKITPLAGTKSAGLYTVDIGKKKSVEIVCGDPNLKKGTIVAVALSGSRLNLPSGEILTVGKKEVRGVISEGIICSPLELGIGEDYYKELILSADLEKYLGKPLKDYFQVENVTTITPVKEEKIKQEESPIAKMMEVDKTSLTYRLREEIHQAVAAIVGKKFSFAEIQVEHPVSAEHGDYATNVAMILAKTPKAKPFDIAQKIVEKLTTQRPDFVEKIEAVPAGFINFWLSNEFLLNSLVQSIEQGEKYGSNQLLEGKTILLEHTSPNPQTTIMLGHLRNNFLGMTMANILNYSGAKVKRDCIINDRGVHICRAIWGYLAFAEKDVFNKEEILNFKDISEEKLEKIVQKTFWGDSLARWVNNPSSWFRPVDLGLKADHSNLIWYVLGSRAYELTEVKTQVEKILIAWEAEDKKVWQIWRQLLDWVKEGYSETYKRIGSAHDYVWYESNLYKGGKELVYHGLRKGIFKKSEGAIVTNLSTYNLPDTVVIKKDGTALYHTFDIYFTAQKRERFPSDLYIWDIGEEQTLYFKQLFSICEQLGIGKREDYFHLGYALINFKGGKKMSTRKGDVVKADEILDLLHERALEVMKNSNQELRGELSRKQLDEVAETTALAGIKYSLLKYGRFTTMYFDIDESLSLEGNSGPYVQYTFARANSVLRKSEISNLKAQNCNLNLKTLELNGEEMAILRTIYKFPEVVLEAAKNFAPNLICNFLFDLAQKYNNFYNLHPIIKAPSPEIVNFRLALTKATAQVIKNGLKLLGIEALERM